MKEILNFINGQYVKNASGKTFEKRTPIDNSLVGMVYEAGKPEVDAAVNAARAALDGPWGKLSVNERVKLLDAVADEINNRFDDFLAGGGRRHRQAAHARVARRHPARRGELQDLRRHDQERRHRIVRDDHARRQDGAQLHRALAARRHRGGLPVEPAAAADDLEGRARRWPAATPSSSSRRRRRRARQRCSAR